MTHLLPGGGVPRVHGAQSPVPPRLPHFASPRSVHHLAAVAPGAYPPRRPLNAWSPGAPAPPGPCYWLVGSGTPLGWRGGWLAVGLVLARCATTALAGAVPRSCVRDARGRFGGLGPVSGVMSSPFPPSRPAFPALCVVGRSVRVSLIIARWYAIPCGLFVPWARRVALLVLPVCPLCVCVCSRSHSVRAPPPSPGWCGACTWRGPGAGRW